MRRRAAIAGLLALVLTLCGVQLALLALAPPATAINRGTDAFANVAPPPRESDPDLLVNRYPLGNYELDVHVDQGLDNLSGITAVIPHNLAALIWGFTKLIMGAVITFFVWAFSLDLLQGNGESPGALSPVAEAIGNLYGSTIGKSWLLAAIVAAGLWGMWKALVQRRYAETAGRLCLSVAFILIALFVVQQPERVIGGVSHYTNQMSLAFLSGLGAEGEDPVGDVANQLHRTFIHEPWIVLQFGGLSHCTNAKHEPVGPSDPTRRVCIDHEERTADGRGGYAARFLAHPPGSDERNAEYEWIKKGETADTLTRSSKAPYRLDEDDRPAVDFMQEGAGTQRLAFAGLIFLASLGAAALLGALALGILLAQIFVLVLAAFAPVVLVAGVFPGRGHDLFLAWLRKLGLALVLKAIYSLVLAVVLAVGSALLAASGALGWAFAFGLLCVFYWMIFLYRNRIRDALGAAVAGRGEPEAVRGLSAARMAAAYAVTRPLRSAFGGRPRAFDATRDDERPAPFPRPEAPDLARAARAGSAYAAGAPALASAGVPAPSWTASASAESPARRGAVVLTAPSAARAATAPAGSQPVRGQAEAPRPPRGLIGPGSAGARPANAPTGPGPGRDDAGRPAGGGGGGERVVRLEPSAEPFERLDEHRFSAPLDPRNPVREEHEDAMRRAGERFAALRGERQPPEPPVARARHRRRRWSRGWM